MWKKNGEKISECQGKRIKFLELYPYIFKNDTRFRNTVAVSKPGIILKNIKNSTAALYYLLDEGRMWKVANAFEFGKSTVSIIVR